MLKILSIMQLGLVSILLISSPALADPLLDPPPQTTEESTLNSKFSALLREGNYAELDKGINQFQQDFENGKRDDVNLMHLFRAFDDTDPALEEKFTSWIAAYPKSYAAFEARAVYYEKMGYAARGGNYIDQTPEQQIAAMENYLKKAMADEAVAVHLTAKPILSCYNISRIAKLVGNQQMSKAMLDEANKIDPANFIVRYKYMLTLETRWGGSLEKMREFRKEVQNVGLTPERLSYLDQLIAEEFKYLARQPH